MEASVPSDFQNKKLPLLNTQVWIEVNSNNGPQIRYEHYEKPMTTQLVVQRNSAMTKSMLMTILTQEYIRISLNCHPDLPPKDKAKHLTKLMQKMKNSDWNEESRKNVIKSGENGIRAIKEKVKNNMKDNPETKNMCIKCIIY